MAQSRAAFISYERASSEVLADELRLRLRASNIDVYSDKDLVPGDNWERKLREELLRRKHYVVILAPTTLPNSQGVRSELDLALKHKKHIIPIFSNGYDPAKLPPEYKTVSEYLGIFFDGSNLTQVVQQIDHSIRARPSNMPFTRIWVGFRWLVGAIVIVLTLLFAGLALFSDEWRNDAFYKLGFYTATPDLAATLFVTQTEQAAAILASETATNLPTDTREPPTSTPIPPTATETSKPATTTHVPSYTPTGIPPTVTHTPPGATPTMPSRATANGTLTLTVFRDEDSLTLYVPDADKLSIAGLTYQVTTATGEVTRALSAYGSFLGMPFANMELVGAACFRLVRNGAAGPVPQICQGNSVRLFTQFLADADVFWYDSAANLARSITILHEDSTVAFCAAGQSECSIEWSILTEVTALRGNPCMGQIISPENTATVLTIVHSSPSDDSSVSSVRVGKYVGIKSKSEDNSWYHIDDEGVALGWVRIRFVSLFAQCDIGVLQ